MERRLRAWSPTDQRAKLCRRLGRWFDPGAVLRSQLPKWQKSANARELIPLCRRLETPSKEAVNYPTIHRSRMQQVEHRRRLNAFLPRKAPTIGRWPPFAHVQ